MLLFVVLKLIYRHLFFTNSNGLVLSIGYLVYTLSSTASGSAVEASRGELKDGYFLRFAFPFSSVVWWVDTTNFKLCGCLWLWWLTAKYAILVLCTARERERKRVGEKGRTIGERQGVCSFPRVPLGKMVSSPFHPSLVVSFQDGVFVR